MKNLAPLTLFKPIQWFVFFILIAISTILLAGPYYKYAVMPGLFTLLLFFLGRFPHIGYYIIIFVIPYSAYAVITESFEYVTISRIVGFSIILVILWNVFLKRKNDFYIKSNLWLWLVFFFFVSLVSALKSEYHLTSFDDLRKLLVAYTIFALTLVLVDRNGFRKTLPAVLIVSISISSMLSILGYIFEIPLFLTGMGSESVTRGTGTASDPNFFSIMIIFSLPLLSHWFFSTQKNIEKLIALILFIINVMAVVLTHSRGGTIILGAVLVLLFLEHIRRLRPKYLGFVILLAAIFLLLTTSLTPQSYWERLRSITHTKTERSIGLRFSYLYVGWEVFKQNPIIGTGPGTFRDIFQGTKYARYYEKEEVSSKRPAHNSYIEVLVGTGLLGLLVFLLALFWALKNYCVSEKVFHLKGMKEMSSLIRAYRLSFLTMLFAFFVLSANYHKYFWLSFALSQIALRLSQRIPEAEQIENAHFGK